ncbi:MAG: F0F1 ATP synthase subunit epsilon [Bacteroidota bacterium]
MTEKNFYLEIVTPKRVIFKGDVSSFTVPGAAGSFQVLRNHASLLSNIHEGAVKVKDASGKEIHYATSGGVVEVRDNRVVLLAETAENVLEIDADRAKAARDRAQKRLKERAHDTDIERAQLALQRALNRLRLSCTA